MTGPRRRVGMALYDDPSYDSRVQREATTLHAAGYEVTVACLAVSDPRALDVPAGVTIVPHRPAASEILPGARSPFHAADPGRTRPHRGGKVSWLTGYVRNVGNGVGGRSRPCRPTPGTHTT